MVEMSGVEKFNAEKSRLEKFLLPLGLKSPGLKLGVKMSGVEIYCNLAGIAPRYVLLPFR